MDITDADIRSLAAKLKGLHALLTPPEQEVLHILLRRAAAQVDAGDGGDTVGFAWTTTFNPFTYLDAIDFDRPDQRGRRTEQRRTPMSDLEGRTT